MMILPAQWFDHLEEKFSSNEFETFCLAVKTSHMHSPVVNVNETLEKKILFHKSCEVHIVCKCLSHLSQFKWPAHQAGTYRCTC